METPAKSQLHFVGILQISHFCFATNCQGQTLPFSNASSTAVQIVRTFPRVNTHVTFFTCCIPAISTAVLRNECVELAGDVTWPRSLLTPSISITLQLLDGIVIAMPLRPHDKSWRVDRVLAAAITHSARPGPPHLPLPACPPTHRPTDGRVEKVKRSREG